MAEEQKRRPRGAVEMGPTAQTVAANVRRVRSSRGWSTYELAGKLAKLGRSIAPSAISKVERGERQVSIDELVTLAVAFGVSPSALLLPLEDAPDKTVEISGVASPVPAEAAWDWMDGKRPLQVRQGDYDALLEYDLYSRPPRRRSSWKDIQGLLPDGMTGGVVGELRREDGADG